MSGKLITFEGIDGCGKSTLAKALHEALSSKLSGNVIFTKEPGGTQLGQALRAILQTQKSMVCDLAEYLLFAADRAQHFAEIIMPTIQRGGWVLADRLADSSLAYQGYGRGISTERIAATNGWAMQGKEPDLTIYVQIDVETAFERIAKRNEALTSFEQEKRAFWHRVIIGYETIFASRNNVITINGNTPTTEQVTCIMKELERLGWLT